MGVAKPSHVGNNAFRFGIDGYSSQRRKAKMISAIQKGMRCRTTKEIRTHGGRLGRFTEGTIQGVIDNLGRELISVEWDSGLSTYVFINEIEVKTRIESEVSCF
jgi:hypothetical protein